MNPAALFRLKTDLKHFQTEHQKFTAFLRYAAEHSLKEGSVVEVAVRQPDGREIHANLRLNENDVRILQNLRELMSTEE